MNDVRENKKGERGGEARHSGEMWKKGFFFFVIYI